MKAELQRRAVQFAAQTIERISQVDFDLLAAHPRHGADVVPELSVTGQHAKSDPALTADTKIDGWTEWAKRMRRVGELELVTESHQHSRHRLDCVDRGKIVGNGRVHLRAMNADFETRDATRHRANRFPIGADTGRFAQH